MSDTLSEIERLHLALFGTVPHKTGTAYERIAALVLATLGWTDVVHDRTERPPGRQAAHQLDVTCRAPGGAVRRLLVECKDWDTGCVGQDEMLKLSTVAARIGASHAAMIAKLGFTEGARAVAVDDDIALIRLRPYDSAVDDGTWIRAVTADVTFGFAVAKELELLVTGEWRPARELGVPGEDWMEVRDEHGAEIGSWGISSPKGRRSTVTRRAGETGGSLCLKDPTSSRAVLAGSESREPDGLPQ